MDDVLRAWRVDLDVEDLAAARFAISPLYETGQALAVIRENRAIPVLAGWARWAKAQRLNVNLKTPLLDELAFHGGPSYPEFLTPSPTSAWTTIDDELSTVAKTPAPAVWDSLQRIWPDNSGPNAARRLFSDTAGTLSVIVDELRLAHRALVRPHWSRLRPLLEADIAFKARRIAHGGYDSILTALHPSARWDGRTMRVGGPAARPVRLSPGGLVFAPTVFGSATLSAKHASSTQTVLRYPARGVANAFAQPAKSTASLARLVGRSRADILALLTTPATPTELSAALGITPSAVTQTLRVLKESGLVQPERVGRRVIYSLTAIGAPLVPEMKV